MKRMSVKHERSKGHAARIVIVTVGAVGAATAGYRHWRHRHEPEQVVET
jgi:hypothetical protein